MIKLRLVAGVAVAVAGLAGLPALASTGSGAGSYMLQAAPDWLSAGRVVSDVAASGQIDLEIALHYRDEAGLAELIHDVSYPDSPDFRHFLTGAQFDERFSPTLGEVSAVTGWLRRAGLVVEGITSSRVVITAHGDAATVERALGTRLAMVSFEGTVHREPMSDLRIPGAFRGIVAGIDGLSDDDAQSRIATTDPDVTPGEQFQRPLVDCTALPHEKASGLPDFKGQVLDQPICGYGAQQLRAAYGVNALTETGKGVTVGVVYSGSSTTLEHDLNQYSLNHGLPALKPGQLKEGQLYDVEALAPNQLSAVGLDPTSGDLEQSLDVEMIHAMAPDADIVYYAAGPKTGFEIVGLIQAVEAGQADVITCSWGDDGENAPLHTPLYNLAAEQAAAKGISLMFADGDNADEVTHLGYRTVDSPSSDLITLVGGSSLELTDKGAYGSETYWGDEIYARKGSGWALAPRDGYVSVDGPVLGGSGGVSRIYLEPDYQIPVVPFSETSYHGSYGSIDGPGRVMPDLVMSADPVYGNLFGLTVADATGKTHYVESKEGGDSFGSPMLAGMVADAVQANHGARLGFLNPVLYSAKGRAAFRDIRPPAHQVATTEYEYTDPYAAKYPLVPYAEITSELGTLHSARGFDDSTGLGSPVAGPLVTLLSKG